MSIENENSYIWWKNGHFFKPKLPFLYSKSTHTNKEKTQLSSYK